MLCHEEKYLRTNTILFKKTKNLMTKKVSKILGERRQKRNGKNRGELTWIKTQVLVLLFCEKKKKN